MNSNQLIVILFGIAYFGFIIYTRRKGNFEEFSVAGRGLGFFLIFSSVCATYIGPGWTMGLAREGYSNGMYMSYIAPISGIGMIAMALILAPMLRKKFSLSYSIGDIVGGAEGHNHKFIKMSTGIVALWHTSAIAIAMSYAGGELINNVFGFPKFWSIAIMTTIVTLYSYFGGIRATIQTDALQFLHFIVLIPVLVVLMVISDNFSWDEYVIVSTRATQSAFETSSVALIIDLLFLWILTGAGLNISVISRVLSSRNAKIAKTALIFAGIFIGIWIGLMIFIGSAGAQMYPELANDDQILLHIAKIHFPGTLYGIFLIAMIGVVMSTQDTLVNSASVIFSQDIASNFQTKLSDQQKLTYSKGYTVALGIASILIASSLESVLGAIINISSYYLPIMFPVTLFAIIKRNFHWQSAITSMISGFLSYVGWKNYGSELTSALFVGILFGIIAYLLSDFLLKNFGGNRPLTGTKNEYAN